MNKKNIISHISVWSGLIILRVFSFLDSNTFWESLLTSILIYFAYIGIFYTAVLVYRQFLSVRKFVLMIIAYLILLIVGSVVLRVYMFIITSNIDIVLPFTLVKYGFARVLFFMLFGIIYAVNSSRKMAEANAKTIQIEKNETELKFLKTQLNPHFFFNTLNNIYGLTYKKDDNAPNVVLKLSEAMRYIIYETQTNFVALKKEIKFIENYVALEKLRLVNAKNVSLNCDIISPYGKISPLILLTFIENCFKHSNIDESDNSIIEINIWEESGYLHFTTHNSFSEKDIKKRGGVGMDNVKKRLKLVYNNDFELKSVADNNKYYIFLKIPIKFEEI